MNGMQRTGLKVYVKGVAELKTWVSTADGVSCFMLSLVSCPMMRLFRELFLESQYKLGETDSKMEFFLLMAVCISGILRRKCPI